MKTHKHTKKCKVPSCSREYGCDHEKDNGICPSCISRIALERKGVRRKQRSWEDKDDN